MTFETWKHLVVHEYRRYYRQCLGHPDTWDWDAWEEYWKDELTPSEAIQAEIDANSSLWERDE